MKKIIERILCFFGKHDIVLREQKMGKGMFTASEIVYQRYGCSRCDSLKRGWYATECVSGATVHNLKDDEEMIDDKN